MILIIDDDIAIQTSLSLLLSQAGYKSVCVSNPQESMRCIKEGKPEVVILDMNFGNATEGKEGIEFLEHLKKELPTVPVILITAWASISLAVEGMKKGAFDFVSKPWDNDDLLKTIQTAIELHKEPQISKQKKRSELNESFDFSGIIGENVNIVTILETVGRVGKTDASVLILGESGTGKELIAEAIHNNSNRKNNPFVKVNLGGISSALFESEMFGHKKGSFTDAYSDRKGRFELAHTGTIFLDEIGDLDFNSQVKLLRVLQDKTYQILGDSATRKTDVRVICATNQDLTEMVRKGTFREDLFYRINLITINLPPLRERSKDIPLLTKFFINNLTANYGGNEVIIEKEALKWLQTLPFSGNVRELKNLIERTLLLSGKNTLTIPDFEKAQEHAVNKVHPGNLPDPGTMTLEEMEKKMILKSLEKYKGNISQVAKSLGLSRGALYRRLEKFNIPYDGRE
ncbi:MAG: sigma-54-dependent Fis family transcriptional regulator [Bacteroidales bacterium]|nr:sigma-54-dependent Fis family transcriptional regulator [Bacteroidales bacterium]